jgi:hypothetical protein
VVYREDLSAAVTSLPLHRTGVLDWQNGLGLFRAELYGGKVIQEPAMENPTIVVLTDRNDLDDHPESAAHRLGRYQGPFQGDVMPATARKAEHDTM